MFRFFAIVGLAAVTAVHYGNPDNGCETDERPILVAIGSLPNQVAKAYAKGDVRMFRLLVFRCGVCAVLTFYDRTSEGVCGELYDRRRLPH